ncbi:hypothetical protein NN561_003370 [Cricetulus griseus]
MKLNISFQATGCQKLIEVDDEHKLRAFCEMHMATEVAADALGDEWKCHVVPISGRNDKQGFPMKQGDLAHGRVRLLWSKGHSCYRPRRTGERKRKSVQGCIVDANLNVLNLAHHCHHFRNTVAAAASSKCERKAPRTGPSQGGPPLPPCEAQGLNRERGERRRLGKGRRAETKVRCSACTPRWGRRSPGRAGEREDRATGETPCPVAKAHSLFCQDMFFLRCTAALAAATEKLGFCSPLGNASICKCAICHKSYKNPGQAASARPPGSRRGRAGTLTSHRESSSKRSGRSPATAFAVAVAAGLHRGRGDDDRRRHFSLSLGLRSPPPRRGPRPLLQHEVTASQSRRAPPRPPRAHWLPPPAPLSAPPAERPRSSRGPPRRKPPFRGRPRAAPVMAVWVPAAGRAVSPASPLAPEGRLCPPRSITAPQTNQVPLPRPAAATAPAFPPYTVAGGGADGGCAFSCGFSPRPLPRLAPPSRRRRTRQLRFYPAPGACALEPPPPLVGVE